MKGEDLYKRKANRWALCRSHAARGVVQGRKEKGLATMLGRMSLGLAGLETTVGLGLHGRRAILGLIWVLGPTKRND